MTKIRFDLLEQAHELCELGEFNQAILIYDRILKKEPNNISALIDKGITLQRLEQNESSLECLKMALSIEPGNIDVLVSIGATLHAMKEFNAAIDYYDSALKIDENFPMALAYKGLALGELGNIDSALYFFKAALSIDRDSVSYTHLTLPTKA